MNRSSALGTASVILTLFSIPGSSTAPTVIHVPADQSTIQGAINSASNGDTVLVSPGTYLENIDYLGKAITVQSSGGAKLTTIDGGQVGSVVTFSNAETNASVLSGFTLRNGKSNEGGGIFVSNSSPTIMNNTITQNSACEGAGIGVSFGSPIIENNVISSNVQESQCSGLGGGGILIGGASTPQILKNTIVGNSMSDGGGGISLSAAGTPLIQGNAIRGNKSRSSGGGIAMVNISDANIIDNIISGNTASGGGGLYWLVPQNGARGPYLISNTILSNNSKTGDGSEIYADGYQSDAIVSNNIIFGRKAQSAFFCGHLSDQDHPVIHFDDVYNPLGTTYGGICLDETGYDGNISADPLFVSQSNVRLKGGSPAIDAGNNTAPDLPTTDFAGNPRIVNGNGGPIAMVDIGAYEFIPAALAPKTLNFGTQPVGSTTTKIVMLTNSQDKPLNISSTTVPTGYQVSGCGTTLAAFTGCSLTVTFHPLTTGSFKGTLTLNDDAGNSPQTVSLSGIAR